jgi:hypothetical protein
MSITQIPTPLEVLTPLGEGWALFTWEWTSQMWWGVAQKETGEVWWWDNHLIRLDQNITEGRCSTTPIKCNERIEAALAPHRARYKKQP